MDYMEIRKDVLERKYEILEVGKEISESGKEILIVKIRDKVFLCIGEAEDKYYKCHCVDTFENYKRQN